MPHKTLIQSQIEPPPPLPQEKKWLSLFHTANVTDLSEEHVVLHDIDVNGKKAGLQRGAESVALLINHAHIIPVIPNTKQQQIMLHTQTRHILSPPLSKHKPDAEAFSQQLILYWRCSRCFCFAQ